ncbi:MAG: Rne/Rng family ribonuclease [Candidatus Zixiibacteriota bacterium]
MQKDIIINVSEYETRLAILEDSKMVELLVERPESERMVGDIHKGIVKTVLPGMQAAFLDIGMGKSAFLHFSDIGESKAQLRQLYEDDSDFVEVKEAKKAKKAPENIQDVLKGGQEILVQITKEPIGTKGPRVTTDLSLPGRYVVLVPGEDHVGVSRKITDWAEKRRLKKLTYEIKPEGFGCIVRTVAEGKDKNQIKSDIKYLHKFWSRIRKLAEKKRAPVLVHKNVGMISSIMRDVLSSEVNSVVIDSKREYKSILSYLKAVAKSLRSVVKLYEGKVPIFDAYNIEPEIEKMLDRKVWVKKGAYFVIDQTEAMVTIDVNTGRYVGKTTQESTVLKTNMDAAKEIARQIRLRDIGGLIIVDFIDMELAENRRRVFEEFKTGFRHDRSRNSILPISDFGLVEMTRERIRPSILHTLSDICPCCNGIGRLISKETMAMKIERWFKRAKIGARCKHYRLMVHPDVVQIFGEGKTSRIRKLNRELGLEIELVKDEDLPLDQFKVFDLEQKAEVTDMFISKK